MHIEKSMAEYCCHWCTLYCGYASSRNGMEPLYYKVEMFSLFLVLPV